LAPHTYCDASVPTFYAFRAIVGRDPDLRDEKDVKLINEARAIAEAAKYDMN
jgi:hypothetical protein